ncbi:MAG: transketolase [Synergistaceae bacterium]|jgi:transketolase|nr:transketolase [Synergistaceae bacterium]
MMDAAVLAKLKDRALDVRRDVIRMIGVARSGHIVSSLSATDILVWLYGVVLSIRPREPLWEGRDRFVLSKGSASPALYATLAERGFFNHEDLWGYRRLGSTLQAFADRRTPGIDVSCSPLGMGPGIASGLALTLKVQMPASRVFCLAGDGELQEGTVWEALMVASHHRLGNLTLIIDRNGSQMEGETEKIAALEPLDEKLESFGWATANADGHDMRSLDEALASLPSDRPRALIAKTVRGKGIPSLERSTSNGKVVLDHHTTDSLLKELEGKESEGAEGGNADGSGNAEEIPEKPERRL